MMVENNFTAKEIQTIDEVCCTELHYGESRLLNFLFALDLNAIYILTAEPDIYFNIRCFCFCVSDQNIFGHLLSILKMLI